MLPVTNPACGSGTRQTRPIKVSPDFSTARADVIGTGGVLFRGLRCHGYKPDPTDAIHCVAPLFITRATPDRVEVTWGSSTLRLSPGDLVAAAFRLVWRKVKHFHRAGGPFGANVQLAHDGRGPCFACFNIEIHPRP